MSTRTEIRTKLRNEIKIDPNGKVWSDSVLNTYIDTAYFKIQKDGNYTWRANDADTTFNTVSGTATYPLPDDFIRTDLVRYNTQELWASTKKQIKREVQTFVPGIPSKYYFFGNTIGFDVIPNATGTIDFDYRKKLATMTVDTDESELPEEFDAAIVKYGAFLAWSSTKGNEATSGRKLEEYGLMLDTLLNAYIFDVSDPRFTTVRTGSFTTRSNVLSR